MTSHWYLQEGDRIAGPYSRNQISAFVKQGRITPTTRVRNGQVAPWRLASEVPGLVSLAKKRGPRDSARTKTPALSKNVWLTLVIGGSVVVSAVITGVVCAILLRPSPANEELPATAAVSDKRATESPVPDTSTEPTEAVAPQDDKDVAMNDAEPALSMPETEILPAEPDIPLEATDNEETVTQNDGIPPADPDAGVDADDSSLEEPSAAPINPYEKLVISDRALHEFSKSVNLETTAATALARYLAFATCHELTEAQRLRVTGEIADWQTRADKSLVRLGTEWVPQGELQSAIDDANDLIHRAESLIKNGGFDESIALLEDASRANPNGIRADYTLGLLYSLPFAGGNAADKAEGYFRKVLRRQPNHAAALNSIAITQVKQRDYAVAMTNFARSAALTPTCQEVAQNMGRLILLAESKRIPLPANTLKRCRLAYTTLVAENRAAAFDQRTGWLHMIPVFPSGEREDSEDANVPGDVPTRNQPEAHLVATSYGSGFVIAPEYVLTNRHVVTSDGAGRADAVGIRDSSAGGRELRGEIVAISNEADLALLRFPGLTAGPMPMAEEDQVLATEVMILGYPQATLLGTSLKAARGIITGLPDPTRAIASDYYLFDATSDHGNSGGPVLREDGSVIGVLTVGFAGIDARLTGGVTSTQAAAFVRQQIPDFTLTEPLTGSGSNWAEITKTASPSVFQLICYHKSGVSAIDVAANRLRANGAVYEDRTCPHCNGRSRFGCPQKGCVRGHVSIEYTVEIPFDRGMRRETRFRKEVCPTCNGAVTVDCRACEGGFDSFLRN